MSESKGGVHVIGGFGSGAVPRTLPDLPGHRLLIIGAFGGRGDGVPIPVEHATLMGLPERLGVTIAADIPNRLGGSAPALAIRIPIKTLRDLDPRRVAELVPVFADAEALLSGKASAAGDPDHLSELRRLMRASPAPEAAPTTSAPPSPSPPPGDDAVDRILGMVDAGPAHAAEPARAAVSAFVSAISASSRAAATAGAESAASELLSRQKHDLLGHDAWLMVEARWRGLKLLMASVDARARIAVEVVDTARASMAELLAGRIKQAVETADAAPVAAIVVLGAFGSSPRELDELDRIALAGADLGVPLLVSLDADVFGIDPHRVGLMDEPAALLDSPAFNAWRGLRSRPEGQAVAAFWNDVLLRLPEADAPALLGEPALIAASLIARSIATTGWPSEILASSGAIGGLDVMEVPASGGRPVAIPLRSHVNPDAARNLARAGVGVLVSRPDRDQAFLIEAPMVGEPAASEEDRQARRFGLGIALGRARLANLLEGAVPGLVAGRSMEDAAVMAQQWLEALLSSTGQGHRVRVTAPPGTRTLDIALEFGRDVMAGYALALEIGI